MSLITNNWYGRFILLLASLYSVVLLHGDMDQFERDKVINSFKKQEIPILVATDVAGRKQSLIFMYKFHSARKLRTQREKRLLRTFDASLRNFGGIEGMCDSSSAHAFAVWLRGSWWVYQAGLILDLKEVAIRPRKWTLDLSNTSTLKDKTCVFLLKYLTQIPHHPPPRTDDSQMPVGFPGGGVEASNWSVY